MQPKQQRALELILAGHSVTDIAAQVGVRRETVWRWRNDPSFASEVSVRQAQRRQRRINATDAVGTGNGRSSEKSMEVPLGACIIARPNCFCITNFRFFPNLDSQPTPAPYEKTGKKIIVRDPPT